MVLLVIMITMFSRYTIRDVLCELASAGDFPLPQPSPAANNKRERDSDSPISVTSATASSTPSPGQTDAPRAIAVSRRITPLESKMPSATNPTTMPRSEVPATFSLPMHSDELGRLPLHGQVAFSNNTDEFWHSTLGNTTAALPGQSLPTNLTNAINPTSSTAFPMEHLFYQQMGNDMSTSLNEAPATTQYTGGGPLLNSITPNAQDQNWMGVDTIAMWSNAPTSFE